MLFLFYEGREAYYFGKSKFLPFFTSCVVIKVILQSDNSDFIEDNIFQIPCISYYWLTIMSTHIDEEWRKECLYRVSQCLSNVNYHQNLLLVGKAQNYLC